ncbi:MAG: late competence development ComFB family protein [Candidatus Sericytochromatia bacterium]|nr:late competence development ComFB family protein [Candidatus Sericytochromatia bacterium]
MSEEAVNYHKHIEQAIQNVLSKVKKIPSSSSEETSQAGLEPESSEKVEVSSEPDVEKEPPLSEPASEEIHYLEADDLYTPMLLEDLNSSKTEDEPPLIADTYSAPYNIFEEFVETELNIMLSRYIDLCRCSQCRADIVAIALHQLPAYYVTGTRGTLTAKSVIWAKYTQQIVDAVTKAINIVYKRPRSNCKKIKQMIWLRPDLEEVFKEPSSQPNQGSLFQQVHTEDIELSFSNEVEEIIQMLEQGDSHDKAALLPVSSPYVHQPASPPTTTGLSDLEIVTNTQPSEPDTGTPDADVEKTEEPEPQMELIEDWD